MYTFTLKNININSIVSTYFDSESLNNNNNTMAFNLFDFSSKLNPLGNVVPTTPKASPQVGGATGGGMQKAIADNAAKMGLTAWNSAAAQNLAANQANFGQQQQNYQQQLPYHPRLQNMFPLLMQNYQQPSHSEKPRKH